MSATGDQESKNVDRLFAERYRSVRRLAAARLRAEPADSMSPTSLVHNAYLRVWRSWRASRWPTTQLFFGSVSRAMNWVIIGRARKRHAKKRKHQLASRDVDAVAGTNSTDMPWTALDSALRELGRLSPRRRRTFELIFDEGFSFDDAAEVLGVSSRTVRREAETAEEYVRAHMNGDVVAPSGTATNGAPRPNGE